MSVEFVVGSHLCSEGFSQGSLVFLPPQKTTLLNSNSIWCVSPISKLCRHARKLYISLFYLKGLCHTIFGYSSLYHYYEL